MRLDHWLALAEARLALAGVDSPRLEAQVLAALVLGESRSWVLAHGDHILEPAALESVLRRREARQPLAYVTGTREFYGRAFAVGPGALVPRQETECLVRLALDMARDGDKVIEVGVGSGCVAVSLALERSSLGVWGVDVSPAALAWARRNVASHSAGVRLVMADATTAFRSGAFDIVVSNPPYVDASASLQPEVRRHEPGEALFAGEGGLAFYRRLAVESRTLCRRAMVVEVGDGMAEDVAAVFHGSGWRRASTLRDGLGHDRAVAFIPLPA